MTVLVESGQSGRLWEYLLGQAADGETSNDFSYHKLSRCSKSTHKNLPTRHLCRKSHVIAVEATVGTGVIFLMMLPFTSENSKETHTHSKKINLSWCTINPNQVKINSSVPVPKTNIQARGTASSDTGNVSKGHVLQIGFECVSGKEAPGPNSWVKSKSASCSIMELYDYMLYIYISIYMYIWN